MVRNWNSWPATPPTERPFRVDIAAANWQPNAITFSNFEAVGGLFDPMQLPAWQPVEQAVQQNRDLPLYSALGATLLLTDGETPAGFREVQTMPSGQRLLVNDNPMPRAWLVAAASTGDRHTALADVLKPDFNPRETLWISDAEVPSMAAEAVDGTVEVTASRPGYLQLDVNSANPAFLAIAQADYPGWQAEIDGQAANVMLANGFMQAVEVPAGSHTVTLSFVPRFWWPSLILAGVGLLLLVASAAAGVYEHRTRRRP